MKIEPLNSLLKHQWNDNDHLMELLHPTCLLVRKLNTKKKLGSNDIFKS